MSSAENQTKKAVLNRHFKARMKMEEAQLKVDSLRSSQLGHGIIYDDMPHAAGRTSDLSGYAAKLDLYEFDLQCIIEDALETMREVETWIHTLKDEDEQLVLLYKYTHVTKQGRPPTWDDVADMMHVSRRTATNLHGKALAHLK